MPVNAAHPDAVKLDEAFAEAMSTPGKPREPGPPPEIDPDAPHGRDDSGEPLAPFGYTKDGKVRRSAAGRKSAEDKARVTGDDGAAAGPPKNSSAQDQGAAETGRYTAGIAETLETVWLGGTMLGTAGKDLPVIGKMIPAVQVQAQAAIILMFRDNIAGALDICAQHNEAARRLAEKCQDGSVGWALNAAFMMLPAVSASLQVWGKQERETDPETGEPLPTLAEKLAEKNAEAFREYLDKLAEQAAAAAAPEPGGNQAA